METITRPRTNTQDPVIRNGVLGMILFIASEIMMFGGLIAGFLVNRADNLGAWPPAWQPRLPVLETAFNTFLLLLSGVVMYMAVQEVNRETDFSRKKSNRYLMISTYLGLAFVVLQGREWVDLINFGMTTTSSLFGAFFYVIVGTHAIHATCGVIYHFYISARVMKSDSQAYMAQRLTAASVFWYFVVGLWPILYVLVYLM